MNIWAVKATSWLKSEENPFGKNHFKILFLTECPHKRHIFSNVLIFTKITLWEVFLNEESIPPLKTFPLSCISLFSLQYIHLFPESWSGKRFQGSAIRAIDSSHRKTSQMIILVKIKKLEKIAKLSFFGHPICLKIRNKQF
jgi:hypothetical protein